MVAAKIRPRLSSCSKKLHEGVQHPADFADVLALGASRADRVELIEEIDATRRLHGVEHQAELDSGLAHELRNQPVEHDREQGQMQLTRQHGRRHRLARPGWADQQQLAFWMKAMLAQILLLTLFAQHTLKAATNGVRKDHVAKAQIRISGQLSPRSASPTTCFMTKQAAQQTNL